MDLTIKRFLLLLKALSRSLCLARLILLYAVTRQAAWGYVLYHQLTAAGVRCVIMAPTTMLSEQGKRIKTDRRDARLIARCLCCNGYHPVHIPTAEDEAVMDYLRMRDDHQGALKKLKQQINAFVLRHGCMYNGTKWTARHISWLMDLENTLDEMLADTLNLNFRVFNSLTVLSTDLYRFSQYCRSVQKAPEPVS